MQYDFQEGSIQIPEGWTDLTINELSSSDEDGFVFQVIRNDSQGEASPRDAMEIAKGQLQTLLGEGMESTADNDLDLSGKPAANLEYRNNSDDPVTVGRMVIVFHQDGKSIMFSASSPVSVWSIHAPEVEEAITSFVVRSQ